MFFVFLFLFPNLILYIYKCLASRPPNFFFSIIQYVKENEWMTPTKIIWWKYISIYIYTINHAHPSRNQFVISSLNNSIAYSSWNNNMAVSKEKRKRLTFLTEPLLIEKKRRCPAGRQKHTKNNNSKNIFLNVESQQVSSAGESCWHFKPAVWQLFSFFSHKPYLDSIWNMNSPL